MKFATLFLLLASLLTGCATPSVSGDREAGVQGGYGRASDSRSEPSAVD